MKQVRITTNSTLSNVVAFVQKYGEAAERCERKYKLPAVAILAQAALETGWGQTVRENNLFNITTGTAWTGRAYTINRAREVVSGRVVYIPQSFRAYDTVQDSFEDYCRLITTTPRYAAAVAAAARGPEAYAKALYKAGYATDAPREVDGDAAYDEKLIYIMRAYLKAEYADADDSSELLLKLSQLQTVLKSAAQIQAQATQLVAELIEEVRT